MHTTKILVVEDEPLWQSIISHSLRSYSTAIRYQPFFVTTAHQAQQMLYNRRDIGLILSDHFINGDMKGFEFWRYCQGHYPHIPFVLISGAPREKIIATSRQAPVFLKKPYSPKSLTSILNIYLSSGAKA